MEKNGKIKKIGCLGAYSFVLFLFAFDCLYFWVRNTADIVQLFSFVGLAMHIGKTAEKEYTVNNYVQLCKVEAVTKNVYICGDVYTWVAKHERSYMIAYEKTY